jgi:hypothetical protein
MGHKNSELKKHWAESIMLKSSETSNNGKPFLKVKRTFKVMLYSTLVFLFFNMFFSNNEADAHSINRSSDIRISFIKIQNLINRDGSKYSQEDIAAMLTPVAERKATSFMYLSSGCTSDTYWLNPSGKRGPIRDSAVAPLEAEDSWDSYPPAIGLYVDKDWDGIRINVRVASQPFNEEQMMDFSDALKLLHQGNYVIWYHPRMLEEDPYGLEELRSAVLDKIVLERESGRGAFYLAELPPAPFLSSMERNVYYTKLGYTQSCIKFSNDILNEFYNY